MRQPTGKLKTIRGKKVPTLKHHGHDDSEHLVRHEGSTKCDCQFRAASVCMRWGVLDNICKVLLVVLLSENLSMPTIGTRSRCKAYKG
eukprot:5866250-Amphidinium_carterae.1